MNLKFILGDTEEIDGIVIDSAGIVQDISGWAFWFTMKKQDSEEDSAAVLQKTVGDGIAIVDASLGKYKVTINPSDRSALRAKTVYRFDIQAKDSETRIVTLVQGSVEVLPDTTHAIS